MHGDETGYVPGQIQISEVFFFSNPTSIVTQRENFFLQSNLLAIYYTFDCLNQRCYLKISLPPAPRPRNPHAKKIKAVVQKKKCRSGCCEQNVQPDKETFERGSWNSLGFHNVSCIHLHLNRRWHTCVSQTVASTVWNTENPLGTLLIPEKFNSFQFSY